MRRLYFILLLFPIFLSCPPADAASLLTIGTENGGEILTLHLPAETRTRVFTLANPERLVVDASPLPPGEKAELPINYHGLVRAVRQGKFDAKTTRIVFELSEKPAHLRTRLEAEGRMTLLRIALSAGKFAPAPIMKAKPTGDPRPVIVIDAGHGGQDPGATGAGGVHEKNIVFAYAMALRRALLATGRYRVVMTRDSDRFIMLHERVEIARRAHGQLFISLHADSAPDGMAHGLSIYSLSETSSDKLAAALAESENKVDQVYGMDLSGTSQDVAGILLSLTQRDTMARSSNLADIFERALAAQGVSLLEHTHRFAGFAVLKAPDIPSVLVELGFVTYPQDVAHLLSSGYRERIIRGLVAGVDAYFAGRRDKEKAAGYLRVAA